MQTDSDDCIDRVRREWRRAKPDLDTAPMDVLGRILRIEHLLQAQMRRTFSAFGINEGGFDVLATLRRSGLAQTLSPTQLSTDVVLTSGAMTHRVTALERRGLVERIADPADRRGVHVRLTPAGATVIDAAIEAHMQAEAELVGRIKPAERSQLAAALKVLLRLTEEIENG